MYVVELETLLQEFYEVENVFCGLEICLVVIRILYTFIHWIYFACNYAFLIQMAKQRKTAAILILYQITVLLLKYRHMQNAGFLMTLLKYCLLYISLNDKTKMASDGW